MITKTKTTMTCPARFNLSRASTKLIHTMRHAAAKAVSDLGLSAAGLVRVRGWFAATPDWQDAYSTKPEDLLKMPDTDPRE
jgi:hypothetical protein